MTEVLTSVARRAVLASTAQPPKAAREFTERSTSPKTRTAYRATVREFTAFLGKVDLLLAGLDDVRRWRDRLIEQGKRPATVAQKLSIVR